MAYVKAPIPSEVYHLTKKENLDSILEDGVIRRFGDTECWFCESLDKMKAYMEQTVLCEGKPYYAVGGLLCRYPKFVPEDHVILKLTPRRREGSWYRWDQEVPPNGSKELLEAAREFSRIKIGYRGDLAFKNAEIIDVPQFVRYGAVRKQHAMTEDELREELRQRIEERRDAYIDSLYRMTPSRLINHAAEIAANHFCYNTLLTMRMDRETLEQLVSTEDPLAAMRTAWVSAREVGQEEEFSHLLLDVRDGLEQEQTPQMTL